MYIDYYGFSTKPFQLSPDPRFFFGSRVHTRALAYLRYGLSQGEGFILRCLQLHQSRIHVCEQT